MRCPKCNSTEITEHARFCPSCGASLQPATTSRSADKIIDYRDLISKITEGYIGRQWVCQAVDDFLEAKSPRNFLLLGEPGCGKTAFMADLVKRRGYPNHFIGKGSRIGLAASLDWRNPVRFAESIGYQLLRDYGGWIMNWDEWGIHVDQKVRNLQGLLTGEEIDTFKAIPRASDRPRLSVKQEIEEFGPTARIIGVYIDKFVLDVEQVVYQLLTTPLKTIATRWPEHPVVIVVDGLDEAEGYSDPQRNIFKMLPNGSLPSNVRFLLSSRPGEHLTNDFLSQARVFWLSEDEAGKLNSHTIDDARAFVQNLGLEDSIQAILKSHEPSVEIEELAEKVASASGGNFLYLYHYAQGLRGSDETLLSLETLPKGLYGIYEDFISKIREQREDISWNSAYKPVLGTMAVAREALTLRQIANFSGVKPSTVGTILVQVEQFLDTVGKGKNALYSIYHASFGEYLVSEDNKDYIDKHERHGQIANYYWDKFHEDWNACDDYGLKNIASHLFEMPDPGKLPNLITKEWMDVRYLHGSYSYGGFLGDVDLAWMVVLNREGPANILELIHLQTARQVVGQQVSEFNNTDLKTLVLLKRSDEAKAHARLLQDPKARSDGLLSVYIALEEGGQLDKTLLDEAFEDCRVLPIELERALSLSDIATAMARAGDLRADEAFSEALAVTRNLVDEQKRTDALVRLAAAMAGVLRFDEALKISNEIQDHYWHARTLCEISQRLTQAHYLKQAEATARGIGRDEHRAVALGSIASGLSRSGEPRASEVFDEALDLARSIQDAGLRTYALRALADVLSQSGDSRADVLFTEAHQSAQIISDVFSKSSQMLALVGTLAKSGRFSMAQHIASSVQDFWGSDALFASGNLAAILAETGKFQQARELIDTIKDYELKSNILSVLALAMARVGDRRASDVLCEAQRLIHDRNVYKILRPLSQLAVVLSQRDEVLAEHLFVKAITLANTLPTDRDWSATVRELAKALLRTGRFSQAKKVAGLITNEVVRGDAQADYVEITASVGRFNEAQEIANNLQNSSSKAKALGRLAIELGRSERFEQASQVVTLIEPRPIKSRTMSELALLHSEAGDPSSEAIFNCAMREALAINAAEEHNTLSAMQQMSALCELAVDLARAERFEQAEEVIQRIHSPYEWGRAICELAVAIAESSPPKTEQSWTIINQVMKLADSKEIVKEDWDRGRLLMILSETFSRLGRLDYAKQLALGIQDPLQRWPTLRELAANDARCGNFVEAFAALGTMGLDDYLTTLIEWAPFFEQAAAGLFLEVIQQATNVAGWVRPDWRNIHELLFSTIEGSP